MAGVYRPQEKEYRSMVRHDPCSYCGELPGWLGTLDHVVPYSAGGASTADNLVGACRRCNTLKDTLDLLMFLLVRVELSDRAPLARQQRRALRARRKWARRRLRLEAGTAQIQESREEAA